MEAELVGDLGGVHGVGQVLLVGEDEEQRVAQLARMCACHKGCSSAKTFLTGSAEKTLWLNRIGAPARRHVEATLSTYAGGLMTFNMIRTTPQGLQACLFLRDSAARC